MAAFLNNEDGATAIEYGLICAMMAIVILAIAGTGGALEAIYETCRRIVVAIAGANSSESGS